jgi:hypothetical protein
MVAFYDTQDNNNNYSSQAERNPLFDQKLDIATEGLEPYYLEHLKTRLSKENALTIANYILSMKVETNLSVNHKRGIVTSLKLLSEFLGTHSIQISLVQNYLFPIVQESQKSN